MGPTDVLFMLTKMWVLATRRPCAHLSGHMRPKSTIYDDYVPGVTLAHGARARRMAWRLAAPCAGSKRSRRLIDAGGDLV